MNYILDFFILLILGLLAYQDFRFRQISVAGIVALSCFVIFRRLSAIPLKELEHQFLLNTLFVVVQLSLLALYYLIRNKNLKGLYTGGIGLGDILFFVILCIAFPSSRFVLYFLIGLVLSLISYGSYMLVRKNANKHTPLAGLLAFFWIVQIVYTYVFNCKL